MPHPLTRYVNTPVTYTLSGKNIPLSSQTAKIYPHCYSPRFAPVTPQKKMYFLAFNLEAVGIRRKDKGY
jgi:hypothetical protein